MGMGEETTTLEVTLEMTREEAKHIYFELDELYTGLDEMVESGEDYKTERDVIDRVCQRLWTAAGGNF